MKNCTVSLIEDKTDDNLTSVLRNRVERKCECGGLWRKRAEMKFDEQTQFDQWLLHVFDPQPYFAEWYAQGCRYTCRTNAGCYDR